MLFSKRHFKSKGTTRIALSLIFVVTVYGSSLVNADQVLVTFTNNAPTNGTYITPLWVGFHDGSFDSYDGGTASSVELERLAEDGNTAPISATFGSGGTLVGSGSQNGADRIQGVLANGGPIAPGETVSALFDLDAGGANDYFSYAAMVLPSNDYYIANGNPFAHSVADLLAGGNSISFDIFAVNDAGTEVNDFAFSAGNPLFPKASLLNGQTGPNQGTDQFGVNQNVLFPYSGFLNAPGNADTNPGFAALNFGNSSLYPRGLGTITISRAIPEPASATLLGATCVAWLLRRKRRA